MVEVSLGYRTGSDRDLIFRDWLIAFSSRLCTATTPLLVVKPLRHRRAQSFCDRFSPSELRRVGRGGCLGRADVLYRRNLWHFDCPPEIPDQSSRALRTPRENWRLTLSSGQSWARPSSDAWKGTSTGIVKLIAS